MVAGLSGDGSIAVGQSELMGKAIAYVWSEKHGMVPLSENSSIAWAISGDGSMIVGRSEIQGRTSATIWKTASGVPFTHERDAWIDIVEERVYDGAAYMQPGHFGEFNAISPDGRILAGQTESAKGPHAFWMDATKGVESIAFSEKLIARAPESAIYAMSDMIKGLRYAATGTFGKEREDGHCLTLQGEKEIACNTMQPLDNGLLSRSVDCAIAQLALRQEGWDQEALVSVGGSSTQDSGGQYVPVLRKLERTSEDQIGAITMKLGALQGGDQAGIANVISMDGGVVAGNASIGMYEKKEPRQQNLWVSSGSGRSPSV